MSFRTAMIVGGIIVAVLGGLVVYYVVSHRPRQTAREIAEQRIEEARGYCRDGDLQRGLKIVREILPTISKTHEPFLYAQTVYVEADCLYEEKRPDQREASLITAIESYESAGFIFRERDEKAYAMTRANLGNAYSKLALVRDKESNLKKAIAAYEKALEIHTVDRFPVDYAITRNNLGNAYSELALIRDRESNLKKAVAAYGEVLKIHTEDAFPVDYAMTRNNLGVAYKELALVRDRESNLGKAVAAHKEALKIYTEDAFPDHYRLVTKNRKAAETLLAE